MLITVNDRASYPITQRVVTDEGFLRVPGNVARAGIQHYLARELGLKGDPNRVVNVYRPEDEVFNADSLASYDGVDITLEHPSELVNSRNYSSVSMGTVRGIGRREGDFVVADLIVKSQKSIDAINAGKAELSAGYTAVYNLEPGMTADGIPYEYVQREIRINHVAVVDAARAGHQARIFDNQGKTTMHKIVLDSGRSVEVQDEATALLVSDTIDRLQKALDASKADAIKAKEEKEMAEVERDAAAEELEEEKKKSSDSAIAARVEQIGKTMKQAISVVGDSFKCDSVDTVEIMRAALAVRRPKIEWADKSAVYVQAAFDMLTEAPAQVDNAAQLAQLAKDAAVGVTDSAPAKPVLSRAQEALLKRQGKGE